MWLLSQLPIVNFLPFVLPLSQVSPAPSTARKVLSTAWSGLETALRLLEKSADAFPPLKSAVGGLLACINLAEVSH